MKTLLKNQAIRGILDFDEGANQLIATGLPKTGDTGFLMRGWAVNFTNVQISDNLNRGDLNSYITLNRFNVNSNEMNSDEVISTFKWTQVQNFTTSATFTAATTFFKKLQTTPADSFFIPTVTVLDHLYISMDASGTMIQAAAPVFAVVVLGDLVQLTTNEWLKAKAGEQLPVS